MILQLLMHLNEFRLKKVKDKNEQKKTKIMNEMLNSNEENK